MNTPLHQLNNQDLVRHVVEQKTLTPLETELMLRLEEYVQLYGDYLGDHHGDDA